MSIQDIDSVMSELNLVAESPADELCDGDADDNKELEDEFDEEDPIV